MSAWRLRYREYVPDREALREALCTVGNGYFATRGAAPECDADEIHYPGTYVAGLYNRLRTRVAGHVVENESLVNLPNWLPLSFRIEDGDWFRPEQVEILEFLQELDLARGELRRELRFRDPEGRETRLEQSRHVHMRSIHLAALQTRIVPENWSGRIEIRSALDGGVINDGVARYRDLESRHLEPLDTRVEERDTIALTMRTNDSRITIAQVARTRLCKEGEGLSLIPEIRQEEDAISQIFRLSMERHEALVVDKILAMYTSRDAAIYTPQAEARKAAADAPAYERLLEEHEPVWEQLWRRFAFELEHTDGDGESEHVARILRLHLFHLLQTASPATMDLDTGVPARGLHGEAYRGHIFWDELFIFPLLNLRMPGITRALLEYRYRRLDEARRAARAEGYRGAMYPWQSSSDGREESQRLHLNPKSGRWIPDNSRRQRHVNCAIAYNVWQYHQVTRDTEFLAFHGAEMILEIARFWASIAEYNGARDRYEIRGVMGPDEYHDAYPDSETGGLNNNAYTNVMVVWVLWRALELGEILPAQRWRELRQLLDIADEELALWDTISRKMFVPRHDGDIISQFEGYEALQEFDWKAYREKYDDIQRLDRILEAEEDTPNRYKASKQADVLMLFFLLSAEELETLFERLGYDFEPGIIPKNIDYYLQRTSHGSTLSRVVHSWVLARSNREGAWRLFCDALESDVGDIQGGTTSEGIHTGAMAGTVDLVQRCFTGIETRDDVLWLNPCLPQELESLELQIHYRQHVLQLYISNTNVSVSAEPCEEQPVTLGVNGRLVELSPGDTRQFSIDKPCGPSAVRATLEEPRT